MAEVTSISNPIPAALMKRVNALKGPIKSLAEKWGVIRRDLKDRAPQIVQLYNDLVAVNIAFTFVEFARLFASDMPTHAQDKDGTPGYQNHPTYNMLVYMRRLVRTPRTGPRGVRDTATDDIARAIKTVLQVVDGPSQIIIWNQVKAEFGFGPRKLAGLQRRVEETKPIVVLKVKPVRLTAANLVHMVSAKAEAAEGEALSQPGRRVKRGRKAA
jgi:hypothetical protein